MIQWWGQKLATCFCYHKRFNNVYCNHKKQNYRKIKHFPYPKPQIDRQAPTNAQPIHRVRWSFLGLYVGESWMTSLRKTGCIWNMRKEKSGREIIIQGESLMGWINLFSHFNVNIFFLYKFWEFWVNSIRNFLRKSQKNNIIKIKIK